jgi:probable HAF family extracellular repeat protein
MILAFGGCERPTEPATASDSPEFKLVAASEAYEPIDLGTLGGDRSYAYGINARGQIVGSSEIIPGQRYPRHAFLWENGEMTDLGTLGGDASWAGAINNRGQVIGGSRYIPGPSRSPHAFLWENGVMTDLGDWGVSDINDRGQIVGCAGNPEHAFLWDRGEMTDLGTLGGNSSCAEGINSLGQVVGYSKSATATHRHAFLWDRGEMTDLGTLGGEWSVADAINDRGQVVGASVTGGAGGERQSLGVLWERGVMTVLGTPGVLGGGEIYVLDINNRGQAVGYAHAVFADNPNSVSRAHLWENGEIVVLGNLGGEDGHANGINNRGQIVGSSDTSSGDTHATLWQPKN